MNRPSDPDARLTAWLEEGPTSGPEQVLSNAFARARSMRQDRVWLDRLTHPTRFRSMNSMLKLAAAAILAVAVGIGVGPLLTPNDKVGSGGPPSPAPSPVVLPTGGTLDQGSYYLDAAPDLAPARFSFIVPAGWMPDAGGVSNGVPQYPAAGWDGEVGFETWIVTHVFTDACHHDTLVDAGTTVEELTAALLGQQGVTTSGPSGVTVAGYPAQHIELTVPADLDLATCTNGKIRFWPGPGPDMNSGMCCIFGPGTTRWPSTSSMSMATAGWWRPGLAQRRPLSSWRRWMPCSRPSASRRRRRPDRPQ